MNDEKFMELLDIYMSLVEKQDDIIHRLSKVISTQHQEIAHLRNIMHYECKYEPNENEDVEKLVEEYDGMKEGY